MMRGRAIRGLAALGVLAAMVVACSNDDDANVLSLGASEYAFTIDGEAAAGSLTLQLENTGEEIHEFGMSRLVGDHTIEDVRAALDAAGPEERADFDGILEEDAAIDDLGGGLFPGTSLSITGSGIVAGDYVLMCFVPDADGRPHVSLGMLTEFTIAEGDRADTPEPNATYTTTDDGLGGPDTLDVGETVFKMVNDSATSREIQIGKLVDGATFEEADEFFAQFEEGPPDAEALAGPDNPMEFLSFLFDAEQDRFLTLDLTPGTWFIVTTDPENPFEGPPTDDPNAVVIEVT